MENREQLDPNAENLQSAVGEERLADENAETQTNQTENQENNVTEDPAKEDAEAAGQKEQQEQPEDKGSVHEEAEQQAEANDSSETEPDQQPEATTSSKSEAEQQPEGPTQDQAEAEAQPESQTQDQAEAEQQSVESASGTDTESQDAVSSEPPAEDAPGDQGSTVTTASQGDAGSDDDQAGAQAEQQVQEQDADQDADQDEEDNDTLAAKYDAMSREELVNTIEELVQNDNVRHIRRHIGLVKLAYRKHLRDENMTSYEQQLGVETDGEGKEKSAEDPLTERFDAAFTEYKKKKAAFDKALEQQMQDNLKAKEDILEELRQLIESDEELKKTYDQFHALQERWREVGPVPRGAKNTLWNNYHFLVEKFFDKVNINKELKDLDLKKNLEIKTELCEKAEELLLEPSVAKSFQQLQKFHEAWKETGPVPKDKKDELWDRFKATTDKLNKRRQEHYENLREEQNKNYAAKLVLCEKAEELINKLPETPRQWQERTDQINELFKVWKTIGFTPKKVNNEVWNRFRGALDTFFNSKKEFFKKYKDQQKENYNQKLNLCLQAEALQDSEDWKNTTEALINLQKEWKNIGPVPSKFSDKIWKRFRKACDHFFNRKSEYFANIGQKQEENLQKKLDLIEKIKNFEYSDDNKENLNILKDFQRQWMEIGHVPIKQKDKVQMEFRKAIDNQFERLNINKKAKNTLSFRNKIENIKQAPNADTIIQKERNMVANKIKTLESDIQVLENNIGFFASSKKAELLKAEFEEKIEKARNEIAVLREKMKILRESS